MYLNPEDPAQRNMYRDTDTATDTRGWQDIPENNVNATKIRIYRVSSVAADFQIQLFFD